ncbi:SLC13 family permease [Oceanobacillus indicireducens]|uniref:SLC13 family permease n=2 Tax=Oceanobacillus indicireducens TaxID=1004261 RepID=A0A917XZW4_9BACI|nr:SLC13 family permease [Oceanobacillus indicireducens]
MEMMLTFIILFVTIILFMGSRLRADLVAILALMALVITGILEPAEALAGFANTVVIMIAGLFVVGAGLLRTGLAQQAGNLLLRFAGDSETKLFFLLMIIVSFVGAFMSNTGTVALMLPVVISIAISIKSSPSKYLIPLSYVGSLTGLLTLIASPANIIASETLSEAGYQALSFFQITPIGITALIVGILYLYFTRNRLLPDIKSKGTSDKAHQLSPSQLTDDYNLEESLYSVKVSAGSNMIGKALSQLKLPAVYQIFILKIARRSNEDYRIFPSSYQQMAGPTVTIMENDTLLLKGSSKMVEKLCEDYSLELQKNGNETVDLLSKELGLVEVLLTPHSSFINKTIKKIDFREKYNLNVVGINRKGDYVLQKMSSQRLKFGDALLVQGAWDDIELLAKETKDVVVIGQPREYAGKASATGKAPIAGLIMLFMVLLMVFEVFAPVISVLIGAVLMVLTGCLRNMDDAYSEMNWESIILIAAMIPMATALEKTGGMVLLSEAIIDSLGRFGALGILAGLYFLTMTFGLFISNTATAVLFAPIAMNAALAIDANPYTFMVAIAVAANMAFSTPVSSPTNAMVMTAGGYKFFDFIKIGVPLQLILFLIMMIVIPLIVPL